ncbi:MAG: hypothetical protein LAT57_01560 [Balneolales bacterium]|nr:hypothetical protein [Balneolales bacterium]
MSEIDATNDKAETTSFGYGFNDDEDEGDSETTNDFPYGFETEPEDDETADSEHEPSQEADSYDDKAIPIWQRFLSADEDDEANDTDETIEISGDSNKNTSETSAHSIATPGAQLNEEARLLLSYLNQNKQLFIDELFAGDTQFFYDSLNKVAGFDTWSQAGRHLTREIFIPNDIDMYSGEAVLFVDLLQQYYEENK